jgi:hypothetical protein
MLQVPPGDFTTRSLWTLGYQAELKARRQCENISYQGISPILQQCGKNSISQGIWDTTDMELPEKKKKKIEKGKEKTLTVMNPDTWQLGFGLLLEHHFLLTFCHWCVVSIYSGFVYTRRVYVKDSGASSGRATDNSHGQMIEITCFILMQ